MLPQPLFLEEVIANLHPLHDQHRYPGIVQADQFGDGVDIHCRDLESEFRTQAPQRLRHFCAQMTTTPNIDSQLPRQESTTSHIINCLIVSRYLNGKKGRATLTLYQHGHGFPCRQGTDQLLKLFEILHRRVVDTQNNIFFADTCL
jgi:hypothetical protein